jgi:hypothetical protein
MGRLCWEPPLRSLTQTEVAGVEGIEVGRVTEKLYQ